MFRLLPILLLIPPKPSASMVGTRGMDGGQHRGLFGTGTETPDLGGCRYSNTELVLRH